MMSGGTCRLVTSNLVTQGSGGVKSKPSRRSARNAKGIAYRAVLEPCQPEDSVAFPRLSSHSLCVIRSATRIAPSATFESNRPGYVHSPTTKSPGQSVR